VDEAIPQRPRHGKVHTTLGRRIACRHYHPTFREVIFTEFAVEHQLITARLRHLRCGRQFVEKEDAFARGRQKFRRHPFCLVCGDARQPAQIDRIKLDSSNVMDLSLRSDKSGEVEMRRKRREPKTHNHV
jgi:hypothetical protein